MSRRLTRHEIVQKDEFVSTIERLVGWVASRKKTLIMVAGGIVAAALVVALGSAWLDNRSDDADRLLGSALSTLQAPLLDQNQLVSAAGDTGYVTTTERDAAALLDLDAVLEAHPMSRAATLAAYMRGATLLRLDRPADAREALEAFTHDYSSSSLVPLARRSLSRAELATGHPDEALRILTEMVAAPSPLVPVDAALMELGRAQEEAGRLTEATETFRRLANEYPDSMYSSEAGQSVARLTTAVGT